jgi:hypothetical protein
MASVSEGSGAGVSVGGVVKTGCADVRTRRDLLEAVRLARGSLNFLVPFV